MWGLFHLGELSGGHARLSILANWARLLITYRRSARLIVEQNESVVSARPRRAADLSPGIRLKAAE